MSYRVRGLSAVPFQHLFGLSDRALADHGAERHVADATPGYPDRVELRDARPGERLLLVNYTHQPAPTPYRASHAIFILEGAGAPWDRVGELPPVLHGRPISLRGFDAVGRMVAADLAQGDGLEPAIVGLLQDPAVDYLHAHFAARGCYAARIERA
jgi:hypothetical protein